MNLVPSSAQTQEKTPAPSSRPHGRYLPFFGIVAAVLVVSLFMVGWSIAQTRGDRLVSGIQAFDMPLGGFTRMEAKQILTTRLQERWNEGLTLRTEDGRTFTVPSVSSFVQYDVNGAVETAYQVGRQGSWTQRWLAPLVARLQGYTLVIPAQIDRAKLDEILRRSLGETLTPARDARLLVEATDTASSVRIEADTPGQEVDLAAFTKALQQAAEETTNQPVPLRLTPLTPNIKTADIEPLVGIAQTWLEHTPFTLLTEDTRLDIKRPDLAPWIQVTTHTQPISLTLDAPTLEQTLRERVSSFVKPAQDGRIEVNAEGKAIAFEAPQEGVDIDGQKTVESIFSAWEAGSSTAPLAFRRITPQILGDGERLGIREVVGVGRSNFSGSPTNRRKNIALGAKRVNMTLVPPGEEFSMIKTLGTIDGANGWLPELVIKGNKTTPEFGGGLCQVGTTMFRAALASGMPITERRNHSYRVRYYEPAGTDATIYDPSPDFKFKNDTAHWLLVTTRIQGDNLEFTVWGTKDGRTVEQTKPRVFNIVAAPSKKIIETLELKPGEEKCTEKEHAGADAQFDYTVTYPDGNVVKKTFFSRYRPWQAVCLRGVETLSQPADQSVDETGVNNPNL